MKQKLSLLLLSIIALAVINSSCSRSAPKETQSESSQLMVGVAIRDITPTEKMLPISRNPRGTTGNIVGVLDSLHVRAIALSSGGDTTLMICSEMGRTHPQVADAVSKQTGLPLEAILIATSHCHAGPELTQEFDIDFEDGADVPNHQRWAKYAIEQIVAAADDALSNMKPASVGIGYSETYLNANRLVPYNKIAEDGTVTSYYSYGYNPTGPSDKTVAAIRFNNTNGDPLAFIINYGMHGTVMHNNTCIDGKTGVSADFSGMVSNYLEEKYKGSVAIWYSGAAGDNQPFIQNMMFTHNPMTGEQEIKNSDSYDMCMYQSKIHFADIETALAEIEDYNGNVKVKYDFIKSSIPAKDSGDYDISLQLLRIGDIALVGFPGEMFSTIGMQMKQNSLLKNTIIVSHSWQRRFQNPGYHADDESIPLNGPGCNAGYKPGYITSELTSMMNSLIAKTNN